MQPIHEKDTLPSAGVYWQNPTDTRILNISTRKNIIEPRCAAMHSSQFTHGASFAYPAAGSEAYAAAAL